MALVMLVVGVLFMNPFRDSLALQRAAGHGAEAELIADSLSRRSCSRGSTGFDFRRPLAEIEH